MSNAKRVLITGASGFVGSNLVTSECAEHFEVLTPSRSELNLLDYEVVCRFLRRNRPQWVIHAAGVVGGIQANISEPDRFITGNALMGVNLLNACVESGVENLINLGSSCMYPLEVFNPISEDKLFTGALEPTNEGYAMAKLLVAKLGQTLRRKFSGIEIVTVIPCNLYGYFDNFTPPKSHLVAAIIQKVHEANELRLDSIEVWGTGTARREFLFAEDLAKCLWMMVKRGISQVPDFVNVGASQDFSVTELYELIGRILGYKGSLIYAVEKPEGIHQKLMDSEWITRWGWRPSVSIEEGLSQTCDFYSRSIRNG